MAILSDKARSSLEKVTREHRWARKYSSMSDKELREAGKNLPDDLAPVWNAEVERRYKGEKQ